MNCLIRDHPHSFNKIGEMESESDVKSHFKIDNV